MSGRLPWEIVETLPSTDEALVARWEEAVVSAIEGPERVLALVGRSLSLYWAVSEDVSNLSWVEVAELRQADITEATRIARQIGDPELVATALLGELYALWDADGPLQRQPVVSELAGLLDSVGDEELQFRIREWIVLSRFDAGDLVGARRKMLVYAEFSDRTELTLFRRRTELWKATLAMLEGRINEAIQINQDAISSTATLAGSPFSFQNVAINLAVEQFFHRTLDDAIDSIRSIRASSPRVASAWDTGLAFALSECDQLDEATELYDALAADNFKRVDRDLNWLVTIQLLGLVAVRLEDPVRCRNVLELMRPFGELDTTHGSGYASYGPVARVLGSLAAVAGLHEEADRWFNFVLESRSAGPWTSLTLLNRAQAVSAREPALAMAQAQVAESELLAFGMTAWSTVARDLWQRIQLEGHGGPVALLEGGSWTLSHSSGRAVVSNSKGMEYLCQLLTKPGESLDVAELDTQIDASLPTASTWSSTLDAGARIAYQQRVDELLKRRQLNEAEMGELDSLRLELSGAGYVRSDSAELERARIRVTKAIRRAIVVISEQSIELGAHLTSSVETGRRCMYSPVSGTPWQVRE